MYADQVVAGTKRSIRERLDGVDEDFASKRSTTTGKRQCQEEGKWKHDLYEDDGPSVSKPKVGADDLRLKLQKRVAQHAYQGIKGSVVRDLREKLSGTMHPQPITNDPPKVKPAQAQGGKTATRSVVTTQGPTVEKKSSTNPSSSKKRSQSKGHSTVHDLLKSLDLEKYSITFQAEEVDMTALMHMTDEDLKALGIPMGPRKKILLALGSKS